MTAAQVEALALDEAQQVLAAWVKARRAELPAALAGSRSRAHARLAKKALYQLKSGGVAVAEPAKREPAAAAPAPSAPPEELSGVLSAILGTGERAIFFARPQRGGGLEVYQGIVSDELGIVQLDGGTSSRSTYRKRLRELANEPVLKVLQVPFSRMREELGRALALNERSRSPLPEGADAALRRLGVEPVAALPELPAPEASDEAQAALGASLHDERELAQWLPPEPQLRLLAQRVEEVKASPLALSDAQKTEALTAKVRQTAAELFTGEVRKLYARRLWAMAELFEASGREQGARIARAEARRLFHTQAPTRFGERMFEKVIELSAAAADHAVPGGAPGGLPAPPGPKTSSGGIVLP